MTKNKWSKKPKEISWLDTYVQENSKEISWLGIHGRINSKEMSCDKRSEINYRG